MGTIFCTVSSQDLAPLLDYALHAVGLSYDLGGDREGFKVVDSYTETTDTNHTYAYEQAVLRILLVHYKSDVFKWTIG